ncbi:hypothetical protein ACNQGP_06495 [Flavobacterium sp. GT2N3]|uniref:hypothetical protein n=1 Tax=unclassified Flavobacterium TaxID=196869 RepID=UPI003AAA36A3
MKKIALKSQVFMKISYLLIFFTFMYSCQTDELTTTTTEAATNKKTSSILKTTTPVSTKISSGTCSIDCIKADSPYFKTTEQQIVKWGGPNNDKFSKTVDIEYYNTATDFILKVKSSNGWSDLVINGISSWTGGSVAENTWGALTIPLSAGWKACDVKSFALQISGNGPQASFNVNYSLFGLCTDCVTSFTAEAISCGQSREVLYTFISDTDLSYFKIQGGLTNFTGADAVVTVTGGTNIKTTQSTPGGSSNRIIKVEGGISKCSEIKIRVAWNSTNTGGTITGSWSVSTNNSNVAPAPILGLTCN